MQQRHPRRWLGHPTLVRKWPPSNQPNSCRARSRDHREPGLMTLEPHHPGSWQPDECPVVVEVDAVHVVVVPQADALLGRAFGEQGAQARCRFPGEHAVVQQLCKGLTGVDVVGAALGFQQLRAVFAFDVEVCPARVDLQPGPCSLAEALPVCLKEQALVTADEPDLLGLLVAGLARGN